MNAGSLPVVTGRPLSWGALTRFPASRADAAALKVKVRDGVETLSHPSRCGRWIDVPRYCAALPDGSPDDATSVGREFHATFTGALRPTQIGPVADVFRELESGSGGAILEAPTGWGKTVAASWLTAAVGRTTCIVVPKGDLEKQTIQRLLETTDIPPEKIAVWRGQKLPPADAWVVVAMLQSVYREAYPEEVYRRFGFLIIDEAHRVAAPAFRAVMERFPARWRLAVSATAERRDGLTALIRAHVGPATIIAPSDHVPPDVFWIDTDWKPPPDKDFNPARGGYVNNSLYRDIVRNAHIAAAAVRAARKGRRTVIFSAHVEHAKTLLSAVRAAGARRGNTALYGGDYTAQDREIAEACAPGVIISATYKMMAEGTDLPRLDTCILAAPLYDPRQAVGRILRKVDGKPRPVVIAVRDPQSPTLNAMSNGQFGFLRQTGARMVGPFR